MMEGGLAGLLGKKQSLLAGNLGCWLWSIKNSGVHVHMMLIFLYCLYYVVGVGWRRGYAGVLGRRQSLVGWGDNCGLPTFSGVNVNMMLMSLYYCLYSMVCVSRVTEGPRWCVGAQTIAGGWRDWWPGVLAVVCRTFQECMST